MFSDVSDDLVGDDLEDVESHGFWERSGLSNDNDVSFLDWEGWGDVDWDVGVLLLVSVVLVNIMQVISSHDDGSLHLGGDDQSLEDSSSDGDLACEGALLVDVVSFNGFLGCLES